MSIKRISRVVVVLSSVTLLADAYAQQLGTPREGRRLAHQLCAQCHGVDNKAYSPNPAAPAFDEIADIPGMTSTALTVALRTSHQSMPNLILKGRNARDVTAYILSLKGTR